jgi:hypothetical protein
MPELILTDVPTINYFETVRMVATRPPCRMKIRYPQLLAFSKQVLVLNYGVHLERRASVCYHTLDEFGKSL